ncbi:MAG: type II secretion system minor pseudopilin GspH [Gammaproteobacteria bacterium]|nr:type II secretion system minor pseudopilin GspH [Gammaproteobacteria bacterium]
MKSRRQQQGFTLLEVLVVAVIASISVSLLMLNVSLKGPEEDIKKQALRLQALLNFAHEQAIIRAEEYGLRFYQRGYKFMIFDEENKNWIDLAGEKHLGLHPLPEAMELGLAIEEIDVELDTDIELEKPIDENAVVTEENKIKPQIFLMSSGELSPHFSSRIRIPGIETYYEVRGSINGQYTLHTPDE